mmetsp:Transcript_27310/g.73825  ORF Transcript_27310/g.73825 Transcript_27310/m.73825 type:complete len:144 (-) Transcript_27310:357-788(-)
MPHSPLSPCPCLPQACPPPACHLRSSPSALSPKRSRSSPWLQVVHPSPQHHQLEVPKGCLHPQQQLLERLQLLHPKTVSFGKTRSSRSKRGARSTPSTAGRWHAALHRNKLLGYGAMATDTYGSSILKRRLALGALDAVEWEG